MGLRPRPNRNQYARSVGVQVERDRYETSVPPSDVGFSADCRKERIEERVRTGATLPEDLDYQKELHDEETFYADGRGQVVIHATPEAPVTFNEETRFRFESTREDVRLIAVESCARKYVDAVENVNPHEHTSAHIRRIGEAYMALRQVLDA
jgi:hypothetical protein